MADVFPLTPDRISTTIEEFSTTVVAYENGVEQRSPNWENSKPTFHLQFKYLDTTDQNTLVAHFKDRKGSFKSFSFYNYMDGQFYTVRFKDDKLNINHTNVALHDFELELIAC